MNKKPNTRRALVLSCLSLLLCISMLIGSTFAWFTDSASTSVNEIKAGTLDVQIVDAQGNEKTTALKFKQATAEGSSNVDSVLFEPGASFELEPIYIKNNGSLALKYQIEVTGIDGDNELNKALTWEINYGDDVENDEGHLAAEATSKAITITVTMNENAGNEFQGKSMTGAKITVYATQDTVEYDSEDNQYDKDAQYVKNVVKDVSTLSGADAAKLEGTVRLEELTVAANAFENSTYNIGSRDTLAQSKVDTFVLDGANISTGLTTGDVDSGFATINVNVPAGSKVVISNTTINGKFSVNVPFPEYPYGADNIADLVFENCTINGIWNGYPSAFKSVTFKNCTFTNGDMNVAEMYNGNCFPVWFKCDSDTVVNFEGCTFNGNRGIHIDGRNGEATVTVKNCIFNLKAVEGAEDGSRVSCIKLLGNTTATVTGNHFNTATNVYDIDSPASATTITAENDTNGNVVADGIKINK